MIYNIIIWLAVKSDKGAGGISLYQTKYDVICDTALIGVLITPARNIFKSIVN
jgi:hypothetical protein